MNSIRVCIKCGELTKHKAKGMCHSCYCKEWNQKHPEYNKEWHQKNHEKNKEYCVKYGILSMSENKSCTLYLGVHIAEQLLSKVFKDVKRMPLKNPGFDFICNKGMKIDVKSSVIYYDKRCTNTTGSWSFSIKKNTIADYFLCLAFDNRENLTPMHIWLIPGEMINHLTKAGIAKSTISKWNEYKLDISKVVTCCDSMKDK